MSDQSTYWNRVAPEKTFTLPIDLDFLAGFLPCSAQVVDYGCGYGRLVRQLRQAGYLNVSGYDPAEAMIARGHSEGITEIAHLPAGRPLPVEDASLDAVLLVGVLTCVPADADQRQIISMLRRKLKKDGILYIVDFPIQEDPVRRKRYAETVVSQEPFGTFRLAEGVTLRHHTREWIASLLRDFKIVAESTFETATMNANPATAFRILAKNTA